MGLWPASDTECGRDGERLPQWDARAKKSSNDPDNAIVIDTHQPDAPLTFDTTSPSTNPAPKSPLQSTSSTTPTTERGVRR